MPELDKIDETSKEDEYSVHLKSVSSRRDDDQIDSSEQQVTSENNHSESGATLESSQTQRNTRMNLRAKLWRIMCKIDELKSSLIQEYREKGTEVTSGTELFNYLKSQPSEENTYKINKDLPRTCIGNTDFKIDPTSGNNQLYNVLLAYANYDKEIGYCQGMNFIVALLIKHLENEEDAFYCMVHIMKCHDWRACYDMSTSKQVKLIEFLECVLETAWPEVYQHIMTEIEISLVPVFASLISTIFIYDSPESVSTHIFDVFLLDGESAIFTLLLKMIELKEETIMNTYEHDLLKYIRSVMSRECLEQINMSVLMD